MHFAGSFFSAIYRMIQDPAIYRVMQDPAIYRVIQEERELLWEVILSAIVRKITSYDHGYNCKCLPR